MKNLVTETFYISKENRRKLNDHHSFVIWFTGLSGSGKSTLAKHLEKILHERKLSTYSLDGDNIRQGLNQDLSFSEVDRRENIRRIAETAKLFVDAGVIVTSSFISPYKEERDLARSILEGDEFIEVFVKASVDECERRDVKGLYKKARAGKIKKFTGISDPYEEPDNPEIIIDTEELSVEDSVNQILGYLEEENLI